MSKRSVFRISAGIGFALILIYLCACTHDADITTISYAWDTINQLKPIAALNTVSLLYLLLAITPLCFALNCGAIGVVCYALWKMCKNLLPAKSFTGK